MKETSQNFIVKGEPSGDAYGCSFGYSDPAPHKAPTKATELPKLTASFDAAAYCVVIYLFAMVAFVVLAK